MLIQITEPGEFVDSKQPDEVAVGIDLGTTHSLASYDGELLTGLIPSVVAYDTEGIIVPPRDTYGNDVTVVRSVKRHMDSPAATLEVGGRQVTPVEVSAEILREVKRQAEEALDKKVTQAVITVPAYFDDTARQATKDAAKLVEIEVLRLLNEPTAASVAYGLDNALEGVYAVYDLGGGTFDLSLLNMQQGVFQVLATGGDTQLGGDDIDAAIVGHWQAGDAQLARKAKEALSTQAHFDEAGVSLSREQLDDLADPFVGRTIRICEAVLDDAELGIEDVKGVVLVGGSSRLRQVRHAVEAFFGQAPLADVDPDTVVAMGAGIQAANLTRGGGNLLLDVTPLSLGLETMGGIMEVVIPRNTPIPTAIAQEFTTYQDGQTAMKIHVVQGEREMVDQCRSLAEFDLRGIPPMTAGLARIEVTFRVDADGLLSVTAMEKMTGITQTVDVRPAYGISAEQMENMLYDSMEHAKDDITRRLLAEARVEAEQTLKTVHDALDLDADLIDSEYEDRIKARMLAVREAIGGEDRDAIDANIDQLNTECGDFAELRMQRAIKLALAGKHVDKAVNE